MNDLVRPAMYDAHHRFEVVAPRGGRMPANVAGPICETGDTFALERKIDEVRRRGFAVLHTTGASGAVMASTHSSRSISPQRLVDGAGFNVVGERTDPIDLAA